MYNLELITINGNSCSRKPVPRYTCYSATVPNHPIPTPCLFLIWLTVFLFKTGLLPFGRDLTFPNKGVTRRTGEVDNFLTLLTVFR